MMHKVIYDIPINITFVLCPLESSGQGNPYYDWRYLENLRYVSKNQGNDIVSGRIWGHKSPKTDLPLNWLNLDNIDNMI